MEHLVSITFNIDDSDIEKTIKEKLVEEATEQVRKKLLSTDDYWGRGDNHIEKLAKEEISKVIQDNKQDIIDKATERLYQFISRSRNVPKKLESEKQ